MSTSSRDFSAEAPKLAYDLYKHLITLDTGSIVLLATFLDKFFKQPEWKGAVVLCLCSFGISVLGCLVILVSLMIDVRLKGTFGQTPKQARYIFSGLVCAWGGYLIGLGSLIAFIIKNLY